MERLLKVIYERYSSEWATHAKEAFESLFGSRYPQAAKTVVTVRAPTGMSLESDIPFAALINPNNATAGAYGGMSFVLFPGRDGAPALLSMVVGTAGLSPDDAVLSRPGHGRKVNAIATWLNRAYGAGAVIAWAKSDPTRTDVPLSKEVVSAHPEYEAAFKRYGSVIYGLCAAGDDRVAAADGLAAFLDLTFEERGVKPLKPAEADSERVRTGYFAHLMPNVSRDYVTALLSERKYAILEGPPGTGKTRLAESLLADAYAGNGTTVQFHPNTTYESFIGGLAPVTKEGQLGLAFAPRRGALMEAAAAAAGDPSRPYLLHIDEINRADLGKVLGEAVYLLEWQSPGRTVTVPYDFGPGVGRRLSLPTNLHILGTMNSADRSIAILDVAIRRRFAFVKMWPEIEVVQTLGGIVMRKAFRELLDMFVEYARGDTFALAPGHSYFLERDDAKAPDAMWVSLVPLLQEYLERGDVAGFAEDIRTFIQRIDSLRS